MTDTVNISIAKDFGRYPGGRLKADGPFSGEEFREKLLIPQLSQKKVVYVDLDGVVGYPACFLEEAFGGAVAKLGLSKVRDKLRILVSDDPNLKYEIDQYMERAAKVAQAS